MIECTIRLSAHVLARDKTQLASQLLARLPPDCGDHAEALRAQALSYSDTIWLQPDRASLEPPGGPLIRTLEGHSSDVTAVALSPDSRTIVSGSADQTIKVWDLASGDCLCSMEDHSEAVIAVVPPADSRTIVSGSWDSPIKVWESDTARLVASFVADAAVRAVSMVNAERIIFGDKGGKIHWLRVRSPYVARAAVH